MRKPERMLMLVLLGCLFQLSCGRDLTRRTAAKAINEKYGYPSAVTETIVVGKREVVFFGDNFWQSMEGIDLKKLQEAGLVQVGNLAISDAPVAVAPARIANFVVKLTPEGSRYLVSSHSTDAEVRLCSEELVEVTGIAFSGDKSQATVEFNSRCSDITPFGKIHGVNESKLNAHQIGAQLYDDGWRL